MSALIKLILCIAAAGVMPVLTGLLPVSFLPRQKRTLPWIILSGYLTTFALFELVGLPILLFTAMGDFVLLCRLFTAADAVVIAAGIFLCVRSGGIALPKKRPRSAFDPDELFYWVVFAALLAFELYMAYTKASYDGDDAYYVAQSVQTWQTGTMYHYVPYTGWTTTLDGRHAMAMMPMWISYISAFSGTHPAIVTHSMLPLLLIPLVDICVYCAVIMLTETEPGERQRKMVPGIMIVLAVMQIFGNVSIYTPETFLIMRTWQGKTLCANLILPAAMVFLLRRLQQAPPGQARVKGTPASPIIQKTKAEELIEQERASERVKSAVLRSPMQSEEDRKREALFFWLMIVILNIAAGFCTSLAPILLTGLLFAAALLVAIFMRKISFLFSMAAGCIPTYLYLILLIRLLDNDWLSFLKGGRLP